MPSRVSEMPSAPADEVIAHYSRRLTMETDCYDVFESMRAGEPDFVLLDVRSPSAFSKAHVPGAVNLPVGKMTDRALSAWPNETLFVVYCAGPHCNGTDRAALRLAQLGRRVKVMIGGMTGWADEGFPFTQNSQAQRETESA